MVGASFLFHLLAKNMIWAEGGIFREKRRMAFIQALYIAKGGLGVKVPWIVQYPCNTSSVCFFCSLISETRRVHFSFFIIFWAADGAGLGIVLLACAHCVRLIYLHAEPPGVASDYQILQFLAVSMLPRGYLALVAASVLSSHGALTPLSRYGNSCINEGTFYSLK